LLFFFPKNTRESISRMEIEKLRGLGLCFGVRRAVKMLRDASSLYGEIETLGPLAHNQQLVDALTEAGVKPVSHLDQVKGNTLAITTHGVSPSVLSEARARGMRVIDTTCPIVRKAQNQAKELAQAQFHVVIFGEPEHSEVKGLLGWAGSKGIVALDATQIELPKKASYRLALIPQTTQNRSAFVEFASQLMLTLGSKARELVVVNTLCQTVQKRREAALRLAKRSQVMIIIGGYNSANTRRLAEACSTLVETHLVETAEEVLTPWLEGRHLIGIAAGTSTPEESIEELVAKLKSIQLSREPA
jgi:4-hydroxy-3-methylbut-2-en-1-yl diphosphate reductase